LPRLLFVFVLMMSASVISARADDQAINQIEDFLQGLVTLQADFSQQIESAQGQFATAEGRFYLRRPGRFRWDYAGDEAQLIVADGDRIWLLDRSLEQVSHQSQDRALKGTPAQLLISDEPLDHHFEIADGGEFDGLHWIELTPKVDDSAFTLVRLGLHEGEISRLEMVDQFDQFTRFQFAQVQRNQALSDDLFRFQSPPGWDVFTH
jgi:outer membrane lipoprotein carrier protein